MKLPRLLIALASALIGLSATTAANAASTFEMQVTAGSYTQTFNSTSGTINTGALSINGGAGEKYSVDDLSASYDPNAHGWTIDLSAASITHSALVPGNITVALTYTGLTGAQVQSLTGSLSSKLSQALPGALINASVYMSSSNTAFGTDTQLFGFGAQSGHGSHGENLSLYTTSAALYSVTIVLKIGQATVTRLVDNVNVVVSAVPEPGSVALMLAGLMMIGGFGFSRARSKRKA